MCEEWQTVGADDLTSGPSLPSSAHRLAPPQRSAVVCLPTFAQDLTEENAQLALGEKASHLASAAQTLPFVPYHPEELRQRGHRQRPGTQRR